MRTASVPPWLALAWLAYTILVLTLDCLALRLGIDALTWRLGNGFDLYKFVAWLVVPAALTLPFMDWQWLSPRNVKRADVVILLVLCGLGAAAVGLVAVFPALRQYYPSYANYPWSVKQSVLVANLFWMVSWLIGWEYLMRYALARHIADAWPERGVVIACTLIPLIEAAYHVGQGKHWLECIGVLGYGLVLTVWAVRRRSVLWPFLAHLFIEVFLIAFILLV